jgi:hypothetical protein
LKDSGGQSSVSLIRFQYGRAGVGRM